MAKIRNSASIRVTKAVAPVAKRPRRYEPPRRPEMPEPTVTTKDLAKLPPAARKAVLEACAGDLYRLSWDDDGSIIVDGRD